MTKYITPSITREFETHLATTPIAHDFVRTIRLPQIEHLGGSPYQLGCQFHALASKSRGAQLSTNQKRMLPWLKASRRMLWESGVNHMTSEVSLAGEGLPSGRVDLLLSGGLANRGCAEFKVVSSLPEEPAARDLLQASGYATLVADEPEFHDRRVWIALIYVSFGEGVRGFFHKGSHRLQAVAREILAA
jgi:hypothetical protein